MTSPRACHLSQRYMDARRQLTDLDAQQDYLATLTRSSLERFDHASDRDRQAAGLEHDALQRAVTLFLDEYERPTRSRLHAKMRAIAAELTEHAPDPREAFRRLARLRDTRSPPPSLADIKARLKATLNRSMDGERTLRRMLAQRPDKIDPPPSQETPPACPSDVPDLAAVLSSSEVPGDVSQAAEASSQLALSGDLEPSFEELSERLDAIRLSPRNDRPRVSPWLRLRKLFRL